MRPIMWTVIGALLGALLGVLLMGCSVDPASVSVVDQRVALSPRIYPAQMLAIIDADTYVLDIVLGWRLRLVERVRLSSTSCPEKNTVAGKLAIEHAQGLVREGQFVFLKTTVFDNEKYGRTLGEIYLENGQTEVGATLVREGVCRPPDGKKG